MKLLLGLVLSQTVLAIPHPTPDLVLGPSGRLTGVPSPEHANRKDLGYRILLSENCPATPGKNGIQLSHCDYLEGVFEYSYQPADSKRRRQLYQGFSVRRHSPASHTLVISTPLELNAD